MLPFPVVEVIFLLPLFSKLQEKMTASFLISYLKKAGWQQVRQQGIHRILSHPSHPNLLSIPDLGGQALKPSLVNDICRKAGLKGRVHKIQFSPRGILTMIKSVFGLSR
jgi:predicted RNA binding protein YcfA (HicA-like mRNA interferase family)